MYRSFLTVCALSTCASLSSFVIAQQPATPPPTPADSPNQSANQQQNPLQTQQPGTAGRKPQAAQDQQAGMSITDLIVKKLRKANEGEIALAKMAQEKSDNEDLRQFTTMIIQDHQAILQQLDQVAGGRKDAGSTTARSASGLTQDLDRNKVDQTNEPQRNATEQLNNEPRDTTDQNRVPANTVQAGANDRATGRNAMQNQQVPQQLCQIIEQACDNSQKMTTEMLQKYQGQDFQMAFLGQQIVAHTMMLGELQAIQSNGPQELKQIAQQGAEKTQAHLEMAKKLAKKYEDDRNKPQQR